MLTKRSLLGASLTTLTTLSLGLEAQAAEAGLLVIGTSQVPRHFNGAVQSGIATAMVSTQVFASPLRFDDKWNPQPYLAKSWSVAPDGLSVTLKLVENATFHDGHPVTADDVAFSIGVIKADHPFKTMLAPVAGVDTPDPHTVVIRLSQPHPALLLSMSPALMPILPKHVYGDGQDVKSHPANLKPIGSGPYKFVEYKFKGEHDHPRQVRQVLHPRPAEARSHRVPDHPRPDQPDAERRAGQHRHPAIRRTLSATSSGLSKSPRTWPSPREATRASARSTGWLSITAKKPLNDVRVRQALGATRPTATSSPASCSPAKRQAATGPIVPTSPFYEPERRTLQESTSPRRRACSTQAGLKKGADGTRASFTIDYIPSDNDQQRNVAEYLRSAYKRIGVALERPRRARLPDLGAARVQLRFRPDDGQRLTTGATR